jgi:hypothetical protein
VNATIYSDNYDQEISVAAAERTTIGPVKTRCKINYEALRSFFLNVKAEVVRQTITNTTQFAHNILAGPNMMKTYESSFPACNVRRHNEAVATNTITSQVPAVNTGGIKVAQILLATTLLFVMYMVYVRNHNSSIVYLRTYVDKLPWTSSSVTALLLRYPAKFLMYYAIYRLTAGKVNPTCNTKTLPKTDGMTSNV